MMIAGGIVLFPVLYLVVTPPLAAFLGPRIPPGSTPDWVVIFEPAEFVYDHFDIYRRYADMWIK